MTHLKTSVSKKEKESKKSVGSSSQLKNLSKKVSDSKEVKEKKTSQKSEGKERGTSRVKKKQTASSESSSSSSSRSRSSSSSSSTSTSSSGSSSSSSSASSKSSRSSQPSLTGKKRFSSSSSSYSTSVSSSPHKRHHEAKRRHSRSVSPRRRKPTSPPRPKKIHVGHLTRNVNKDHLYEIFGLYGSVKLVELPTDRMHGHASRGFAYVEYENCGDAEKAIEHMDGGQIDGQAITVAPVLLPKPRPPLLRRMSPVRRGPYQTWRRSPPFRRREWDRDRRRRQLSPYRYRSPPRRSPGHRRSIRRSSSSSQ